MSIKLQKACRRAKLAPMAEREILSSIPDSLTKRLTSAEIAAVMLSLNAHWHKACAWKEAEILGEGCIWDSTEQKLREIAA